MAKGQDRKYLGKFVLAVLVLVGLPTFAALAYMLVAFAVESSSAFVQITSSTPKVDWNANYWAGFPIWIQAAAAVLTLVIGGSIFWQLKIAARQFESEREQTERELYLPLIGVRFSRVKRFCAQPFFQDFQNDFFGKDHSGEKYNETLSHFRAGVLALAEEEQYCIENHSLITLDDIEYVISYYTYLSKLIHDGSLREKFATELGVANFINFYDKVYLFIKFRAENSASKYAMQYSKYVDTKREGSQSKSWPHFAGWFGLLLIGIAFPIVDMSVIFDGYLNAPAERFLLLDFFTSTTMFLIGLTLVLKYRFSSGPVASTSHN